MIDILNTRLDERQLEVLPTEDDVTFYEEHGWSISKKILSYEIIDEAIRGSGSYYRRRARHTTVLKLLWV